MSFQRAKMAPSAQSFTGGPQMPPNQHNPGQHAFGLRFHSPCTLQSVHSSSHNCKQLFITHLDHGLVAMAMAPDLEASIPRREYLSANRWMVPIITKN